ncbi:pentatricopeptide repeat-containing protein, partial [Tanacetum coccineum]
MTSFPDWIDVKYMDAFYDGEASNKHGYYKPAIDPFVAILNAVKAGLWGLLQCVFKSGLIFISLKGMKCQHLFAYSAQTTNVDPNCPGLCPVDLSQPFVSDIPPPSSQRYLDTYQERTAAAEMHSGFTHFACIAAIHLNNTTHIANLHTINATTLESSHSAQEQLQQEGVVMLIGRKPLSTSVVQTMKERNLIKEARCSWIVAENQSHKFYVVPDTDFILHELDEKEKEQCLVQHSEKIVVVFGLISTSKMKPLRVFKNLRVCGDCDTAMKYISVERGREIVVRDSNRQWLPSVNLTDNGDFKRLAIVVIGSPDLSVSGSSKGMLSNSSPDDLKLLRAALRDSSIKARCLDTPSFWRFKIKKDNYPLQVHVKSLIAEVDRVFRPEGKLIVHDNIEILTEIGREHGPIYALECSFELQQGKKK